MVIAAALITALARKKNRDAAQTGAASAMDNIKGFALDLILGAEQALGAGTGQFKKAQVVGAILNSSFYIALPAGVKNLITYDALSALVDKACEIFKNQLESNRNAAKLLAKDGE